MGSLCGNPNFEMLNGRIFIFGFEKEKEKDLNLNMTNQPIGLLF
jgi:hypothetical protein